MKIIEKLFNCLSFSTPTNLSKKQGMIAQKALKTEKGALVELDKAEGLNYIKAEAAEKELNFLDSIKLSHATVGRAVLITSLAISLGFLTLCFSN